MFNSNKRPHRGFSLVELLVSIFIVAVLSAILFPSFTKMRQKAKEGGCTCHMMLLSLAMVQYVSDYDETYPRAVMGNSSSASGTYTWAEALYPYAKTQSIFVCPSDEASASRWNQTDSEGRDIVRNYIPIIQMGGETDKARQAIMDDGSGGVSVTASDVQQPANTVWLTEAGSSVNESTGACLTTPCRSAIYSQNAPGLYVGDRTEYLATGCYSHTISHTHLDNPIWAFSDGHAKRISVDKTISSDQSKDLWVRAKTTD
jgi:prepilin-type N-terminal cleavage/methylation domain-containing protein